MAATRARALGRPFGGLWKSLSGDLAARRRRTEEAGKVGRYFRGLLPLFGVIAGFVFGSGSWQRALCRGDLRWLRCALDCEAG